MRILFSSDMIAICTRQANQVYQPKHCVRADCRAKIVWYTHSQQGTTTGRCENGHCRKAYTWRTSAYYLLKRGQMCGFVSCDMQWYHPMNSVIVMAVQ